MATQIFFYFSVFAGAIIRNQQIFNTMQYSKAPQENKLQNQLYHSQYPQDIQKLKNEDESNMRLSLISLDNNRKSELDKSSCRGNKFSYQYKRVNNMFKLVSI